MPEHSNDSDQQAVGELRFGIAREMTKNTPLTRWSLVFLHNNALGAGCRRFKPSRSSPARPCAGKGRLLL